MQVVLQQKISLHMKFFFYSSVSEIKDMFSAKASCKLKNPFFLNHLIIC